jgi:putative ABC transport system permease protein
LAIAGLFITGLALFVGAIGIMNITFVSVKERTREIGTRKALGARRRTILIQFLIEAISICLVGGTIGLALAFGLFGLIGYAFPGFPMQFSPMLVATALFICVLTGIFAGFAPAWQASRLNPVEALRYE